MSSKDYIYCYQGSALRVAGGTAVIGKNYDKYNPLGLGYGTMRLKFAQGYTPTVGNVSNVLVDAEENIWDCTSSAAGQPSLPNLAYNKYLLECISANLRRSTGTGFVTGLSWKFQGCSNLVSVSLPCTDHVTDMSRMFFNCTSLTSCPLLDTSSCTNMSSMFEGCVNIQSGSLDLYQQASTQATPPSLYTDTFKDCGRDTVTGAAELAQIPTSWGGTMAE